MKFYCGIDLSARDCHLCVIDEQLQVVRQQKLRNDLGMIVKLLAAYKANLTYGFSVHRFISRGQEKI